MNAKCKLEELESYGVYKPMSENMIHLKHDLRKLLNSTDWLLRAITSQNIVQPQTMPSYGYPNKVTFTPYFYNNSYFY